MTLESIINFEERQLVRLNPDKNLRKDGLFKVQKIQDKIVLVECLSTKREFRFHYSDLITNW